MGDLCVAVRGAMLAGSVWMPDGDAKSVVLMIPGSGASTRTCNGYFQPLIDHLLRSGHMVAGFDKRSAGESTGTFADTDITTQAADMSACLDAVVEVAGNIPVGLFGHSQGGWVAFELAADLTDINFCISNSGPAVGPAKQERFRLTHAVEASRRSAAGDAFDQVVAAAHRHAPVEEMLALVQQIPEFSDRLNEYVAGGAADWNLEMSFMRYDPTDAIARIAMPTLVVHGELDTMVPVPESLAALNQTANPHITTLLFADGDHRLLGPDGNTVVDGYLDAVSSFVSGVLD